MKSRDLSFDEDAAPRGNFSYFLQDGQTVSADGKTIQDLRAVEFPDQEEEYAISILLLIGQSEEIISPVFLT
jgi:hypothetical protein